MVRVLDSRLSSLIRGLHCVFDQDTLLSWQCCHGQGKVREKQKILKVREKSRNFVKGPGKS